MQKITGAKLDIMIRRCLITLIFLVGILDAESQGLFESSLNGSSDDSAQKNLILGGFIRSALYLGNTPVEKEPYLQSAYAQAGLKIKAHAGNLATARADIRFRYGTEWQEGISEWMIREAYVDLQTGPAGFRFGKLISPWGKGTIFNPVDKITPLDPTVRSPDPDDRYLGIWAVQGRINLGSSIKFTATWNPIYQPGRLLIDPVPMPSYVNFLDAEYPGVTLDESNYGLQLDLHTPAIDASLYAFNGYHSWPGLAFDGLLLDTVLLEAESLDLYEKAYRIWMTGADLSIPIGSWIFRAEAAWSVPTEERGSKEYLPFPELSYAAEIEVGASWLTAIAGYHGKYIVDYSPSPVEPGLAAGPEQLAPLFQTGVPVTHQMVDEAVRIQIAAFNRLYNYQLEEFYHSAFLAVNGTFLHDQLEVEIPLIYHSTTQEWILQPSLSWIAADGIKLRAGYHGFIGPEGSLFDMIGPTLNTGFLALTLSF